MIDIVGQGLAGGGGAPYDRSDDRQGVPGAVLELGEPPLQSLDLGACVFQIIAG